MARISLKNVMIEYQVNQRDEYGDAVDIDHIPVFAGKTWSFYDDYEPETLVKTLDETIRHCIRSEYNDIEVYVHMELPNGDTDRVYGHIGDKVFYAFNGDYCVIPPIILKDWDGRTHKEIEKQIAIGAH